MTSEELGLRVEQAFEEFQIAERLDRPHFLEARRRITSGFSAEEWKLFLGRWVSANFQIPELVSKDDIREHANKVVYRALGLRNNSVAQLLKATIDGYGILDDDKCAVYFAQTDKSAQVTLSNAFFTGEHAKQYAEANAKHYVRYAWDHNLKNDETPVPELLKKNSYFCGGVYTALGLNIGNTDGVLRISIENYGVLDDEKCELYISRNDISQRGTFSYVLFTGKDAKLHAKDNVKRLVRYAWKHYWKSKQTPIPELLKKGDVFGLLGVGAYKALSVKQGQYTKILNFSIDGFGVLDDEKCKEYITRKKKDVRRTLSITFFTGEEAKQHAKANVTYLIRYAWEHHWKSDDKPIPECVDSAMLKTLIGGGVYPAFGIEMEHNSEMFRLTIENYGKLNDEKCEVLANQKDKGIFRTMSYAFFSEKNAKSNAEYFVKYLWNNKWKSDKTPMPELVDATDMDKYVGLGVYTALGLGGGNIAKLLKSVFEDFGVLDDEKAEVLCREIFDTAKNINHNIKTKLREIFFYDDNKAAEENKQKMLTVYQQIHQKRLLDLGEEDNDMLPREVSELIAPAQTSTRSQTIVPSKRNDVGYHTIHVEWTDAMTNLLQKLYETHKDALFGMKNILWGTLGITSFSAMMKASELGLIAPITFGNSPSSRMPHYAFVRFNGYQTFMDMAEKAKHFETLDEIDTECFITPANEQGIHVQIPINFKGIRLTGYTDVEQQALRTIATFIYNPNIFRRENDIRGLPYFSATSDLIDPHGIVPVIETTSISSMAGDASGIDNMCMRNSCTYESYTDNESLDNERLVKLYLPIANCKDFGGVFSSVLNIGSKNIFLFRHYNVGCVE